MSVKPRPLVSLDTASVASMWS